MGFSVGDQVDFMLPLLGLKAMLGSAVVAHTAAAQDDDDGPHQPEPWGQRGKAEMHTRTANTSRGAGGGAFPTGRSPDGAHLVEAGTVRPHLVNSHLECVFHFYKCLCQSERRDGTGQEAPLQHHWS